MRCLFWVLWGNANVDIEFALYKPHTLQGFIIIVKQRPHYMVHFFVIALQQEGCHDANGDAIDDKVSKFDWKYLTATMTHWVHV